jgi:hypothetical protein
MLSFKKGVDIKGITQNGILLIYNVAYAYEAHGYDCVVTSVCDGAHMKNSKHYEGNAADFRTWPVKTKTDLLAILETAKYRCGKDCDIIVEKDHIHGEYQPHVK